MRKLLWLLSLCILFALIAPSGSALATESSSVQATIDGDRLVTISGFISAGPGQAVSIRVVDPAGKVDYVNSVVTAGLGNFRVSYSMPSVTPGTYQVTVNTLTETIPIVTSFAYGVSNDLQSLSLSRGGLNKAFAPNTTEYAVNVDSRVDSIKLTPTVSDSTATVKVNGIAVTSGQPSADIQLVEGINTITVAVTSCKGETKTYTIVVTKAGALATELGATAAIDSGKQVTVSGTIDAGAGQLVNLVITDPKGDIEYVGTAISNASGAFELSYQLANVVNGRYQVQVSALGVAAPVTTYFDYVELTNLVVSDITLSPAFDKDTTLYTAAAGDTVESVTVTPTCGDSAATITVNGQMVASGAASAAVMLDASTNTINVVVTGQDGEASRTYVVTIEKYIVEKVDGTVEAAIDKHKLVAIGGTVGTKEDRQVSVLVADPMDELDHLDATETAAEGAYEFSYTTPSETAGAYPVTIGAIGLKYAVGTYFLIEPGNPNLESLTLGSDATWSSAFSAERAEYDLFVPSTTDSVTITPTAIDPMAIIRVNDVEVESGAASESISLDIGTNVIQVLVTTMDGQEKTYTLSVVKNANDATLSSLVVSEGSLGPSFAADKTSYAVTVDNLTKMVSVTPTVNEATATMTVNGNAAQSGAEYGPLLLDLGANTIEIAVTSGDKTTQKTYTVTVNREKSKDATLSDLVAGRGSLNPSFAPDTTEYAVTVINAVTAMTVTPTVNEGTATVHVNGSIVASGSASGLVALNVGTNTIKVEVTAGDGTTKKTYTLTVTREKSTDASLSALGISSGSFSPEFTANRTGYAVTVVNTVTSLTVTPTVNNIDATVKVNGSTATSGKASGVISLNVGKNAVTVEVTAADGVTKRSYVITVIREASNDATLRDLGVSGGGTLKPSFATDTTSYDVTVKNEIYQITVTPTVNESTARVWVNGAAVPSGKASVPVILSMGANKVEVEVKAGDGVAEKTYTVTVTRDQPSNVNLRDLTVSSGSLNPIFALGRTNYNVSVGNEVTSLTVSATAYDSKATVRINNASATSGSASRSINLDEGSNTITVEVMAQNGTKQVYTITVNRARSSNAYLRSLTISSGSLSPAFSATTPGYAANVGNDVTSVTVTPTVSDSDATVKVNNVPVASGSASGPISLGSGPNTINIVVTAANGGTRSYTIVVTRAKSGENNLSSLTLSDGTLNPAFAAGTPSYTVSVGNEVDRLTVTATAAHPQATVALRDYEDNELFSPISLNVGPNLIRVVVTAENGSEKRYVLQVTRAKSTNADLSDLSISAGNWDSDFDASDTEYTVAVANDVASLTVTPIAAHAKATVALTDSSGNPLISPINLQLGANAIKVVVTAENTAVKKTYVITVDRARRPFTVTYDKSGGDEDADPTTQPAQEGLGVGVLPTPPTRAHYDFAGWNTEPDGSGDLFDGNTEVYGDIIVYAQWTPKQYTVTFSQNGGSSSGYPATRTAAYLGYVASLPENDPVREHYTFDGWNTKSDGTGTPFSTGTQVTGSITVYAKWVAVNYTVSFDLNYEGATGHPEDQEVPFNTQVGALPDPAPTREHFSFGKWWYRNNAGTEIEFTADTTVTGDMEVYAKWTRKNYTVTFKIDGSAQWATRTVAAEGTLAGTFWPTPPTRTHYAFDKWKDSDGNQFIADTTKVYGDLTVFAHWTPVDYIVFFDVDGGDPILPPQSDTKSVAYGTAVGDMPTPMRTHYDFGGWYTGQNGTGTKLAAGTTVLGPVTVYAKWTPKSYTVTFDANEGTLIGSGSKMVTYYHEIGALPSASRAHYTFAGWWYLKDGVSTKLETTTRIIGDIAASAKWEPVEYAVTFDENGVDAVGYPVSKAMPYGAKVSTLLEPDPTSEHHAFSGWKDGDGEDLTADTTVTGPMTFYAQWIPNTYTITFDLNYEGAGTNPDDMTVTYPANLGDLPDPTRVGYEFAGWNTEPDGVGTGYADNAPLTRNADVYAQWIQLYNITVAECTDGNAITAPGSAKAEAVVTLTVQPNSGWRLKAGTLECLEGTEPVELTHVSGGTYTFEMPAADVAVTAEFERYFTVTFDKDGGLGANVTVDVVAGQIVGSDMPPDPTWVGGARTFAKWADGEGNVFTATTEVTKDITVYAQWTQVHTVIGMDDATGQVSGSPETGAEGTVITVTVTPAGGYRLKANALRYRNETTHGEVPIAKDLDGKYRFAMPDVDVTLLAEFEQFYTVTFMNEVTEHAKRDAASGKGVDSMPTAPNRTDYRFMGWEDGDGAAFTGSTEVTANITVYAQWSELFDITIDAMTDGAVEVLAPSDRRAIEGETVRLKVTPESGKRLVSGSLKYNEETIDGSSFTMPAADVTVTAQFEEIPPDVHSVSISVLGDGNITAIPATAEAGTTINLTVTADEGWRLASGTLKYNDGVDHLLGDARSFMMPSMDVTVSATFEPIPNVTLQQLGLSDGLLDPVFGANTTAYAASVANDVKSLTVTAEPTDSTADVEVTVGGTVVSEPINLEVGENVIKVKVTSADATETNTYTVTVTRAGSDDATLSDLAIQVRDELGNYVPLDLMDGAQNMGFSPTATDYLTTYAAPTGSTYAFQVVPTANDSDAEVRVAVNADELTAVSGVYPVELSENGGYMITVEVTASDGVAKETYTVNLSLVLW